MAFKPLKGIAAIAAIKRIIARTPLKLVIAAKRRDHIAAICTDKGVVALCARDGVGFKFKVSRTDGAGCCVQQRNLVAARLSDFRVCTHLCNGEVSVRKVR